MAKYLILQLLLCPLAFAAPALVSLTATCNAPTMREDGSLLDASEIDFYRFVLVEGNTVISDTDESTCNKVYSDIQPGTYGVTVTVYATDGERSEAVSAVKHVKKSKSGKAGNLALEITP